VGKIQEEVDELREVVTDAAAVDHERAEEEMGDLLFSIANLARKMGIEPEAALRKANAKFSTRFTAVERRLETRGRTVHDATLDELEAEWQQVKAQV
jgi:ATP diphosphatase